MLTACGAASQCAVALSRRQSACADVPNRMPKKSSSSSPVSAAFAFSTSLSPPAHSPSQT